MLRKFTFLALIFTLALTACGGTPARKTAPLEASGVIEAPEITLSPEVGGAVAEIFVSEGDSVKTGDPLFRLQNGLLEAQYRQAQAAVESAQAALEAAKTNRDLAQAALEATQAAVDAAQAQYDLTLQDARAAEEPDRAAMWRDDPPDAFNLPLWYFTRDEKLQAARNEVQQAQEALQAEQDNYQSTLDASSAADVRAAEERLVKAQAAFQVAEDLLNREVSQKNKDDISDYVQTLYDSAKAELDAAQLDYDQLLSTQAAQDLLEARARLSVAQERYELALDRLEALQTGRDAPDVRAAWAVVQQAQAGVAQAQAGLSQAEAAITQAEKGVAEAQAALDAAQVQMDKLTVYAPADGVITTRSIEVGEVLEPGVGALALARLKDLTVTVYLPENRYGEISLGQAATLRVDSFPDETFSATVTAISDKAEYTPRNVQTKEERVNTVYAVKLSIEESGGKLKPGMPADVTFENP